MATKKRNQKTEQKQRKRLYEKYGHLINVPKKEIPEEHQTKNGSLRCFRKTYPRDSNNQKMKDKKKKRCKNAATEGSLYCKCHGGGNSRQLVHGKSTTLDEYRGVVDNKLDNVLEAFLNDPAILDHKIELATLRTVLTQYIDRFSRNKPVKNRKKLLNLIEDALYADDLDDNEKFQMIKDIVDNEVTLTDGQVIDRISRLVDSIGKAIDRIDKVERKSDYFLSPEGFKIVLRTITDLITTHVVDQNVQKEIRKGLLEAGTKTINVSHTVGK